METLQQYEIYDATDEELYQWCHNLDSLKNDFILTLIKQELNDRGLSIKFQDKITEFHSYCQQLEESSSNQDLQDDKQQNLENKNGNEDSERLINSDSNNSVLSSALDAYNLEKRNIWKARKAINTVSNTTNREPYSLEENIAKNLQSKPHNQTFNSLQQKTLFYAPRNGFQSQHLKGNQKENQSKNQNLDLHSDDDAVIEATKDTDNYEIERTQQVCDQGMHKSENKNQEIQSQKDTKPVDKESDYRQCSLTQQSYKQQNEGDNNQCKQTATDGNTYKEQIEYVKTQQAQKDNNLLCQIQTNSIDRVEKKVEQKTSLSCVSDRFINDCQIKQKLSQPQALQNMQQYQLNQLHQCQQLLSTPYQYQQQLLQQQCQQESTLFYQNQVNTKSNTVDFVSMDQPRTCSENQTSDFGGNTGDSESDLESCENQAAEQDECKMLVNIQQDSVYQQSQCAKVEGLQDCGLMEWNLGEEDDVVSGW